MMRRLMITFAAVAFAVGVTACQSSNNDTAKLKSQLQRTESQLQGRITQLEQRVKTAEQQLGAVCGQAFTSSADACDNGRLTDSESRESKICGIIAQVPAVVRSGSSC